MGRGNIDFAKAGFGRECLDNFAANCSTGIKAKLNPLMVASDTIIYTIHVTSNQRNNQRQFYIQNVALYLQQYNTLFACLFNAHLTVKFSFQSFRQ